MSIQLREVVTRHFTSSSSRHPRLTDESLCVRNRITPKMMSGDALKDECLNRLHNRGKHLPFFNPPQICQRIEHCIQELFQRVNYIFKEDLFLCTQWDQLVS